jgi:hypothetical protein
MGGLNPLDYPLALDTPHRLTDIVDWHPHIPFAFALVEMLRPRMIVELGTYRGDSFCAMCQAVATLRLDTACIAIDRWTGDLHVGPYDEDVYLDLQAYVAERYGRFATLVRSAFDDAVERFGASSIDLLHLDGTHTYDAVRHDFEQWIPKMSHRGVVIMHDTQESQPGFGVTQLWGELRQRYPSYEFAYGHGLGVLATGTEVPKPLQALFDAGSASPIVAQWFQVLGERVTRLHRDQALVGCLRSKVASLQLKIAEIEAGRQQQAAAQSAAVDALGAREHEMLRQRETIESLQEQVGIYAGEIARLETERRLAETQRDALQGRLSSNEAEIAALRADLNTTNRQLAQVYGSTPYRIARVVRHPGRLAGIMRRR